MGGERERWHTGRVARGAAYAGTLLVRDGGGMPESGGARRQRGGDARAGDGEGEGEGKRAHAPRGRDVPTMVPTSVFGLGPCTPTLKAL